VRLQPPATETVLTWGAGPVKLGTHATREIGTDAAALGIRHALIVTDRGVARTDLPGSIVEWLAEEGIAATVYDGTRIEPTDRSVAEGARAVAGVPFDGILAVGGGSSIDTAKGISLLTASPAELSRYLAPPHGAGAAAPDSLPPLIAVPTTAGSGSEVSLTCLVELVGRGAKGAVSHPNLRPNLAVVDPLNTLTMPAAVTAASGYDVLAQALESWTALPMKSRPRASRPFQRTGYVGANPISDVWAEKALELVGRHFVRAVEAPSDLDARVGMVEAATFARFANAGAHIPHALGYPIAGLVREYVPLGYDVDEPLVPHGSSVIVTTPAVYDFLYPAAPGRQLRAAALLGADLEGVTETNGRGVLSARLRELVRRTGGPSGLSTFGYDERDVPALVEGALAQHRLLVSSPLPLGRPELELIVRASLSS
jgi:hydroxyacid-oxoacid transhydrogenase